MKIGAHVKTAGGVDKAVARASAIGAECIQIFSGAPMAWKRKVYAQTEVALYRHRVAETGIEPAFIHGLYLVKFATDDTNLLARSYEALVADMQAAHLLGARGVIFHLGSHKGAGYEARVYQVADYVARVIVDTPEDTWLILENSVGMGGAVGSRFRELGEIVRAAGRERVKICLDTQHAFAAGYDLRTREAVEHTMDEFDREVGIERLVVLHANDSKCPLGGRVDRHENIGDGYIGREGFENILAYPGFADLPFILEVPGYAGDGPDKANIDSLKDIRSRLSQPATPGK